MSAPTQTQTHANHARYVPGFHFVTGSLTIIILGWALYRLATVRSADALFGVLVGVVLLAQFIYLRQFPLKVQDRLIRLEERLRIARLVPSDQQAKCDELTADQLIALRFASDAEVPALVKRVLNENIKGRAAIKALVVNWRPDHMRA
ncbi:MAG TPA: DUF6526 family protein [Gemmatimonadaceae bacterium]|nr:DUF6526 family protein [Gemmatimonadaceae bacterium]